MSSLNQQSQPPQAALDQIIGLYNLGQLEQTVSLAESLAKQYPKALILYDILGAAYIGLTNTQKIIESYQKALQLNPNHTDAYNNMGMALYDQGRFDEAVEVYQKAVKLEPEYADAHYNLGNALKQTGDLKQAIESYKASLAINPNDVELLFNYGNALKSYGDFDQAIEAYFDALKIDPNFAAAQTNMDHVVEEKSKLERLIQKTLKQDGSIPEAAQKLQNMAIWLHGRGNTKKALSNLRKAIAVYPKYAEAYSIQGIFLSEKGDLEAAIDSYKQAIKIKPDYAEAYLNMGNALKDKGNANSAIESYEQAIKIKPDYAEAYSNIGSTLLDWGELKAAIDSYEQAVKIKPGYAEAYLNMGVALKDKGNVKAAIESYEQAIKIKPDYVEAYLKMGNALMDKDNVKAAIESYKQAIKIKPDYAEACYNMGIALRGVKFSRNTSDLSDIIVKILNKNIYVRPSPIVPAAVSLIKLDEVFQSVLNRFFSGELEQTLEQSVSELSRIPLLYKIMEVCPISDLDVEWLLTYLRSAILNNVSQLLDSKETLAFQAALALQCFTNEYIYNQTDEDKKILADLENSVQKDLADGTQPAPLVIACLASYKALHDYSWCHLLAIPDELKQLGKRQVSEVKKETELRSEIPILNEIMDDISSKVRQQYEENPYPRWISLGLPLVASPIANIFKNINLKVSNKKIYDCKIPQILVAGCGTGQHSIETAARFKNCNVLAIDLSLSSLAYAKRKTAELGIKNIEYMQADILDLGKLGRQFDVVESAGVLHHMNDPMAGWSVLTRCLKPEGLMRLGLYSKLARQHIVKMREEIQLAGLGYGDFAMQSFRTDVINSDQKHHGKILSSPDFYSLSTLRDLLFHVQEHRFTIPQIKNCLTELGLEFCGFEFEGENILKGFKLSNVATEDLYNLGKWNTFEQDNPDTFRGMYQFWCQKVL